jgi:hypothetical protein
MTLGAGHWWLTPVILASQEAEFRRITVRSQPGQIVHELLSQKYPIQKRADGVAQVVEHLPGKCESLSSSPRISSIINNIGVSCLKSKFIFRVCDG